MLNVIVLTKTCGACPAQWEGVVEDGRMIYIRFRWGWLSVRVSNEATKDISDAVGGKEIFGIKHGAYNDGFMEFEELEKLTKDVLDLSDLKLTKIKFPKLPKEK